MLKPKKKLLEILFKSEKRQIVQIGSGNGDGNGKTCIRRGTTNSIIKWITAWHKKKSYSRYMLSDNLHAKPYEVWLWLKFAYIC